MEQVWFDISGAIKRQRAGLSAIMKTHAIHWKSSVTGTMGTGTKLFEKSEAERLATELNESYPEIDHEAIFPPMISLSRTSMGQGSPASHANLAGRGGASLAGKRSVVRS